MLTLFASLIASPLFRKVGMYAILAASLLLGLRWYSNKAYSDGRSEGVKVALSESITSSEKNWKADLETLQKRIDASSASAALSASRSNAVERQASEAAAKSAQIRSEIPRQVAAIPVSDLAPTIVANDAAVKPDNTESLQRALLTSQMTNKELLAEVQDLTDEWREYKLNASAQVAALQDQLTATQGQLHVMTVERDAYKASFESATKKRGCGTFKKIVTLGVCR